jgi:hypothetical protein
MFSSQISWKFFNYLELKDILYNRMITHYMPKNMIIISEIPINIFYLRHHCKLNVVFQPDWVHRWQTVWHMMGRVIRHSACWMNGAVQLMSWSYQRCNPFHKTTAAPHLGCRWQALLSKPSSSLIGTVFTCDAHCSFAEATARRWTKQQQRPEHKNFPQTCFYSETSKDTLWLLYFL